MRGGKGEKRKGVGVREERKEKSGIDWPGVGKGTRWIGAGRAPQGGRQWHLQRRDKR